MILLLRFFSIQDAVLFPVCVLFCYFILRARANRNKEERLRRLYYRAFWFKVICVLAYTLIVEFVFKGGDTAMYFQASKDLRTAIADDGSNIWLILKSSIVDPQNSLYKYFYYDNYQYDITANYMLSTQNFSVPKLALLPSYLFGSSYLCINMCFGFIALGGMIRLFKFFYYFYPKLYGPLALGCLFLPGVGFWSSGLLKDPISFACIGFLLYAVQNILFKKKNYVGSAIWIIACGLISYYVKVYILLVFVLSVLVWIFAEFNKLIKDRTLRNIFAIMTLVIGIGVGFLLLRYMTSSDNAKDYQLDQLATNAERERAGYAAVSQQLQGDSHFEINTSNPVSLVVGGVTATFFRPFPWEVSSPVALLSALESGAFLVLTLYFIFKKGIRRFFTLPFEEPKILLCFVFAFVFAAAVGSATANFGALSRYKIPCMPMYMVMIVLMYYKSGLAYPRWFQKVVRFAVGRGGEKLRG